MSMPTDPYNSASRRPFEDEENILDPLSDEEARDTASEASPTDAPAETAGSFEASPAEVDIAAAEHAAWDRAFSTAPEDDDDPEGYRVHNTASATPSEPAYDQSTYSDPASDASHPTREFSNEDLDIADDPQFGESSESSYRSFASTESGYADSPSNGSSSYQPGDSTDAAPSPADGESATAYSHEYPSDSASSDHFRSDTDSDFHTGTSRVSTPDSAPSAERAEESAGSSSDRTVATNPFATSDDDSSSESARSAESPAATGDSSERSAAPEAASPSESVAAAATTAATTRPGLSSRRMERTSDNPTLGSYVSQREEEAEEIRSSAPTRTSVMGGSLITPATPAGDETLTPATTTDTAVAPVAGNSEDEARRERWSKDPGEVSTDIPEEPKPRTWAHIGGFFLTLILIPIAWYLIADAGARLYTVPNNGWDQQVFQLWPFVELLGGVAVAAILWLTARRSSLGAQFFGLILAVAGSLALIMPKFAHEVIAKIDHAIGSYNDFTGNVVYHLTNDLGSGRIAVFGFLLLFTGLVSHLARRRGERRAIIVTRRDLLLAHETDAK
ncbi:hypothetical protein [Trueperella sp. LYQ143]|uniref:hypothetical protein n=1 Tax=Trueperella sp. LYQ143 TaxID=3391059 RepID=UPI0039836EA7